MTTAFNPIDYALLLESEGVPPNQANVHAKALADVLSDCTVRPQDLIELSNSLNTRMSALELGMVNLRKDMDVGFARVDAKLALLHSLCDKLQEQINMLKWMLGFVVALQTGLLVKAFL